MDQKQELRKRMKEKRDRISPQERRQKSAKICERLLSAPEYARFQKILVYAAIRSEVELQLFCDQALRDRKQIFFPKVCGKEMEFYRIENSGQLKKGMFSVPEPDVKGMILMAVLSLYYGFSTIGIDNWCHVGGILTGFLVAMILYHKKVENC